MDKNIYHDGRDWIHISESSCLVYPEKVDNFENFCNQHIDLFTKKYYPNQGDTVIDLGSGVGAEITFFSKSVGESGHVYAIEADPSLHEKNLKVVDLMNLKNVTCLNYAVMDKEGQVEIGRFSLDGVDSSIYTNNSSDIFSVTGKPLDYILDEYSIEYVDYIKINIEGAEYNALMGISDCSRIKNWCVSTHDFCGIKTKNFVVNYFNSRGMFVELHEEINDKPWEGGYVYVKQ
jgi:FkbM family methyltransferase